jgi:phage regulator Rha-like protein
MSTTNGQEPGKDTPEKEVAARLLTTATTSGTEQLDSTGADLPLTTTTSEARIDSRLLALQLNNKHRHVMALLDKYVETFKKHGHVSFKNADGERRQGGGKAERYALLNENQAYFLLNLSRNTEIVVALKSKLITAFSEARRATDLRQREYLPAYHHLQEVIHIKAAGSANERHVHMNVAKLLNKTVGLEAGQRASAPVPQQALLIVAQSLAARAMQGAQDHHDGFQRVKQSMLALTACTMLEAQ